MVKLEAAARLLASEDWWDELDKEQQEHYVKEHPNSDHTPGPKSKSPKEEVRKPYKHPDLLTPEDAYESWERQKNDPKVEYDLDENDEPVMRPPPRPKAKPKKDKDDSLVHTLLEKGKEKAGEVYRKGAPKALHQLLDPMGLTHHHAPSGGTRSKYKAPKKSKDGKEQKNLMSPDYKKSGGKGISPYGYWKDSNTWMSETKEEWESKLTDKERKAQGVATKPKSKD